ncbi:MAG TPA: MarR family transcriptional regulator [Candidatus Limnocylindrales bacterium]|nr:MarR family transcriptional regulator [Candidatus Limnocylindrales bacterium]
MTLNIDATSKKHSGAARSRPLVGEVVDVLTSWGPRDFIGAFQRFHAGSISLIHLNVLILLEGTGPLPMSRLAEALDISVASITGVVDRMEARGLVARRRDAEDRRVILVEPAEGGRRLFADIDARRRKGLSKLLERLSEKDLQGLLHGHQALRAARAEMAKKMAADELEAVTARAKSARVSKIEALVAHASRTPAHEARS